MFKIMTLFAILLSATSNIVVAGSPPMALPPAAVPTLSNFGIIGMILALGVAVWIRSNKK